MFGSIRHALLQSREIVSLKAQNMRKSGHLVGKSGEELDHGFAEPLLALRELLVEQRRLVEREGQVGRVRHAVILLVVIKRVREDVLPAISESEFIRASYGARTGNVGTGIAGAMYLIAILAGQWNQPVCKPIISMI